MTINFKEKGFQYERKLAGILGQWWCGDKKALWRNTNSGARATVVGKVYGGDIIPANASCGEWPLCIEIKKQEHWSIDAFVNGNPGENLLAFMLQCLSASQLGCNKIPILIVKKNHRKDLVFLHSKTAPRVGASYIMRLAWRGDIPKTLIQKYPWDGDVRFECLHLDTFLSTFKRKDFIWL